jgi:low affinity Fe/Cu permease
LTANARLDEVIRVTKGARTALLVLEELDEKNLEKINQCYEEIAPGDEKGKKDTGMPFVHLDRAANA